MLVARIVIPACIVSVVARSSSIADKRSITDSRMRFRSSASMPVQLACVESAPRAAAIARPASSRPHFGTVANTSSVAGFTTSNVSPDARVDPLASDIVLVVLDLGPGSRVERH